MISIRMTNRMQHADRQLSSFNLRDLPDFERQQSPLQSRSILFPANFHASPPAAASSIAEIKAHPFVLALKKKEGK